MPIGSKGRNVLTSKDVGSRDRSGCLLMLWKQILKIVWKMKYEAQAKQQTPPTSEGPSVCVFISTPQASYLIEPEMTFPLLSEQCSRSPLSVGCWKVICSRSTSRRHLVPLQSSSPSQSPPPLPPLICPEVKLKIFISPLMVLFGFYFNSLNNVDCWPLWSHWIQILVVPVTLYLHKVDLKCTQK